MSDAVSTVNIAIMRARTKKGSQQAMKAPVTMASVLAAFRSRLASRLTCFFSFDRFHPGTALLFFGCQFVIIGFLKSEGKLTVESRIKLVLILICNSLNLKQISEHPICTVMIKNKGRIL